MFSASVTRSKRSSLVEESSLASCETKKAEVSHSVVSVAASRAPAVAASRVSICGSAPSVKNLTAALNKSESDWRAAFNAVDSDSEESATVLFATDVSEVTFDAFVAKAERTHCCSMRLEGGSIFIYELPLARHEIPSMKLLGLADRYQYAQALRRVPPAMDDEFTFAGSTLFSLGPGGRRAADQTMRNRWNVNKFPSLIIEVGASETLKELDADAQFWFNDPRTLGHVQVVIIVKVYQRRPHPTPAGAAPGPFAAVAALYLRGQGGAGVGRVVNPALPAAPAPVIPTAVVSFGSAPVAAGAALAEAQGLGAPLTGFVGGAAPCAAPGMAAYALTVPATHLYFGVPAAHLPAGFPGGGNDWTFDLFELVFALNSGMSFREGL